MLRAATTLLIGCLVLGPGDAFGASIPKGENPQTILILDSVDAGKSGVPLASKAGTEVTKEYVGGTQELLTRVGELQCEEVVGIITIEEKPVDNTLRNLLDTHLQKCPTPLVEVGIEDMDKLKIWAGEGFKPFKESTGTSEPALRIRGSIALPDGGRGEFVVASGDTGSWIESWKMSEPAVPGGKLQQQAPVGAKGCAGGLWHTLGVCCVSQHAFCTAINGIPFIGPLLCSNCYSRCYTACRYGCISDPCHSCDPCGFTWLLCHVVPGAHC